MKVTIKPVLWEHKPDKEGRCPVAISITGGGQRTYHKTNISVLPDNWKDGRISKAEKHYDINNARIDDMVSTAKRDVLNWELQQEAVTIEKVKRLFQPDAPRKLDFYKFADTIITEKNAPTKRRYNVEIAKLKKYTKGSLSFADVTPEWLTGYYRHLLKENTSNTAINAFKVIRHIFNEAKDRKLITQYPFDEWEYPKYKAPKREYLTLDECDRIYKLLEKDEVGDSVKLVCAFFLLECFSGIRVSDWGKFSIEKMVKNEDMIFTTTKTGTDVRLPLDLMPSLNKIVTYIRQHKLKYTFTPEFANETLKLIQPLAKITKRLHTHLARHTFATQCLSIGMSKEAIAVAMGITSRQVDTYAKIMPNKLRNELQRLGGGL